MAEGLQIATGITDEMLAGMFPPLQEGEVAAQVGVIMGSDSDLPFLEPTFNVLDDLEITYEAGIVSAHRTPEWMAHYGHMAVVRGLKVIIAAAGGSAHLPGDMASLTRLPVLGVAREDEPDPMNAALGSMIEMPAEGGPLAVIGKNKAGAANAALVAARILALNDPELADRITARMAKNSANGLAKHRKLQNVGVKAYLANMKEAAKTKEAGK